MRDEQDDHNKEQWKTVHNHDPIANPYRLAQSELHTKHHTRNKVFYAISDNFN